MTAEKVQAFLYTQTGVNESLNSTAREELGKQGVSFKEIDLTDYELDEDWPDLPVISSKAGFAGGFRSLEILQAHVSFSK